MLHENLGGMLLESVEMRHRPQPKRIACRQTISIGKILVKIIDNLIGNPGAIMSEKKTGLRQGLTNYGDEGFSLFLRKAFIKGAGYTDDALSRPIVAIANTGSAYNPCHGNAPQLIEAVKRGVMLAGGLPVEFPTISIAESFSHPTSMYLRNLMSMDTEEMIRAQPAAAGVPAIQLVTGAMLTGSHRGERVGACTDCRRFWASFRGDQIDEAEIEAVNNQLVATVGTCSVMGTASTMACIAEALGIMLPGGASAPAVTADRIRIAERTGAQAVAMIGRDLSPATILTPKAIENALRVLLAIGGSTNGIIHLTAIAGRLGIRIDLEQLDRMARETPVLVDLKPSGQHYMEDLHRAGGLTTVMREIKDLLHLDALTVTGRTLGEELDLAPASFPQEVVRPFNRPIFPQGGIAVLRGNLAPGGAIIKQSAASASLMEHEGRAVVFEDAEDLARRIDDPELDVEAHDVLVLKRIGPVGAPGMPEAGYIPIPRKLGRLGVKDMVRISDGRMSGTASGTVVLHVTPEAAIGGPLAIVQTGDRIRLSVAERSIELALSDAEIAARLAALPAREVNPEERGYRKLFLTTITQADEGCDFDFLQATQVTATVPGNGNKG
jgi:dihydroxy-acid dehydratase